ncbi:MAG TPA: hypothetical protein VMU57_14030 [Edaphobacter sp.]|uniref:hypothetical protein n=1 Tax=Edaphobacter sp. TaxID=1934404 RepID=UPI002C1EF4A5|nr:hypothetical protein [Edaphobacter sp.]HUZ96020.1 hypothetical protein [Edaphobacter sp.]
MTEAPALGERLVDSSAIDESLGQILSSARFKDSAQLQTLLKYIVEESLKGHDDALKERIIGIEVFGRKPDYDTADDPIVRSRVGLLRKRLAQYYESEEAKGTAVRIVIPSGSYYPTFVFHRVTNNESKSLQSKDESQIVVFHNEGDIQPPVGAPNAPTLSRKALRHIWVTAPVMSAALLFAVCIAVPRWRKNELYLLWKPILENNKTVLLYTGTVSPVYRRTADPLDRTTSAGDEDLPAVPPSLSPLETLPQNGGVVVPVGEGLAPPADITADLKVGALMSTYRRNLSLRSGLGLPFVDLKGSPTILIGAYDNYWTMDLARELPFFLDRSIKIRERHGQHRFWSTSAGSDSAITEDYAIIFRLLDSKTGGPVIAIAGLTTCGTQAAAEFATDPEQLKKLADIPRDELARRNLEFVLRASLVNCTPTSVDIVAQQVW